MRGWVKDSYGQEKYLLEGKWDTELYATNLKTNEKIQIWKRKPLPLNSEWYYHFTEFTMNLNHLNVDLIKVENYIIELLSGTSMHRLPIETGLNCFRDGMV